MVAPEEGEAADEELNYEGETYEGEDASDDEVGGDEPSLDIAKKALEERRARKAVQDLAAQNQVTPPLFVGTCTRFDCKEQPNRHHMLE